MKYEINEKNLFVKSSSLKALYDLKDAMSWDRKDALSFITKLNDGDKLFVKGNDFLDDEVAVKSFNVYIEKDWISSIKLEIHNLKFHNGETIEYLLVNASGIENLLRKKGDVVVNVDAKLGNVRAKGWLSHIITVDNDYLFNFIIKNENEEIKGKLSIEEVFSILDKILK